jgi:hypothetical protein
MVSHLLPHAYEFLQRRSVDELVAAGAITAERGEALWADTRGKPGQHFAEAIKAIADEAEASASAVVLVGTVEAMP